MVDPVQVTGSAETAAKQAARAAQADATTVLSFGQKRWWAVALGALVLGFVVGKL